MQLVAYILIYPFLYLISILPFRLLYAFSDLVYVLVYYVVGYRKSTVTTNLKLVFPDKSDDEISTIKKKFYRHMCDMFLEMIKSITVSRNQILKRFIIKNPEELRRLEALDKSIVTMYGHYASYEWSVVIENHTSYNGLGIYKRIKNVYFDRLARRIRSKYNTKLVSTKQAMASIVSGESKNIRSMIAFLSDQSPKVNSAHHWVKFMGIKVPCHTGAEMLAKNHDLSVTFLKINKVKRGYYEAEFIPLADDPRDVPDYEITDKFTVELEKQIYEAPEYYLWTHKRWKHKDKAPKKFP